MAHRCWWESKRAQFWQANLHLSIGFGFGTTPLEVLFPNFHTSVRSWNKKCFFYSLIWLIVWLTQSSFTLRCSINYADDVSEFTSSLQAFVEIWWELIRVNKLCVWCMLSGINMNDDSVLDDIIVCKILLGIGNKHTILFPRQGVSVGLWNFVF